jgi:hypothetical protein
MGYNMLMKTLILAALTVGIWTQGAGQPEKRVIEDKGTLSANKTKSAKQNQQSAETEAIQRILNQVTQIQQQNAQEIKESEEQKNQDKDINREIERYTLGLVVVGALQALILAGTVVVLIRQNATAVNSERAWLMVEIGNMPNFNPLNFGVLHLIPHIRNFGKTEGRIRRISIRLHTVPTIDALPPEPEYLDETNRDVILQPQVWVRPWDLSISMTDFAPIHQQSAFLYFYGYVNYADFGGHQRQTGFCFIYTISSPFSLDSPGFYPAANVPEAYTRCT